MLVRVSSPDNCKVSLDLGPDPEVEKIFILLVATSLISQHSSECHY